MVATFLASKYMVAQKVRHATLTNFPQHNPQFFLTVFEK